MSKVQKLVESEEINLEIRHCLACQKGFKVLATSPAKYCRKKCEQAETEKSPESFFRNPNNMFPVGPGFTAHGGRPKGSKKNAPRIENEKETGNKKAPGGESFTGRIQRHLGKNAESMGKLDTGETQKRRTRNAITEPSEIPATIRKDESGGPETERNKMQKSENENAEETRLSVSTEPFGTLSKEKSHAMNLIDDSARRLFALMMAQQDKTAPGDLTPTQVASVCSTAQELQSMLRLRLDFMKLKHDVNKVAGVYKRTDRENS